MFECIGPGSREPGRGLADRGGPAATRRPRVRRFDLRPSAINHDGQVHRRPRTDRSRCQLLGDDKSSGISPALARLTQASARLQSNGVGLGNRHPQLGEEQPIGSGLGVWF